jgi:DNA gyrase subunit A
VVGRNTQGVRVIRLDSKEKLIGVDKIDGLVDDESDEDIDQDETSVDEQTTATDDVVSDSVDKVDPDTGESE